MDDAGLPEDFEWARNEFDPNSDRLGDPYPIYSYLREQCPVAHSKAHEPGGFWILSRYDDVKQAALDAKRFANGPSLSIPAFGSTLPLYPEEANGDRHAALRRLIAAPMGSAAIARHGYAEQLRDIVGGQLDRLIANGGGDLMKDLAFPVPARVMFSDPLLGNPPRSDGDWLDHLRDLIFDLKYVPSKSAAAAEQLEQYVRRILLDRQEDPKSDIPSTLVAAVEDESDLEMDEAAGMLFLLLFAGIETPANAIGLQLLHLARDPSVLSHLRQSPEHVKLAVQELHRFYGPSQGTRRTLTEDVEMHGVQMKKGDAVWLLFNSANRDEGRFDSAESLDLERSPNPHLGFGVGIHRCVGAPLAMVMMRVVLEQLSARVSSMRLRDDAEPEFAMGTSRSLKSLNVELQPLG